MRIDWLNSDKDTTLYEQAWLWQLEYPDWFSPIDSLLGAPVTFEDFLRDAREGDSDDAGFFDDHGNLVTLVTLTPRAAGVYELSLLNRRGMDASALGACCASLREYVFSALGASSLVAWVVTFNFGVVSLLSSLGFGRRDERDAGFKLRGRPVRLLLLECVR